MIDQRVRCECGIGEPADSSGNHFCHLHPFGITWNSMYKESDPNGKAANESGAKMDHGKNRMGLVLGGFARALQAVGEVGTFGANKYTDNGWIDVPDGERRYTDAMLRHLMKEAEGEVCDPDSGLAHAAHLAWNALSRLDLMLRKEELK